MKKDIEALLQRYHCGPVKFTGGKSALYKRHLTFDQVIPLEAASARDRYEAIAHSMRDRSFVRVRIAGDRELVFGDVLVRVDPSFKLAMHIDTDEANAANVHTGAQGFIEGIQNPGAP